MSIHNYLSDFDNMVQELKDHKKIHLFSYHAFDPAPQGDISEVEDLLGFKLDPDLVSFYRQCNGLQLRWAHEDNPGWDRNDLTGFVPGPFTWQDVLDDAGTIDGCVNILPIKEVFFTDWVGRWGELEYYPEDILWDGEPVEYPAIIRQIRTFNLKHWSSSDSILLNTTHRNATFISTKNEHRDCINSSRANFFQFYKILLKSKGMFVYPYMTLKNKKGLNSPIIESVDNFNDYDLSKAHLT